MFYDIDDDDEEEAIVFYRLDVDNSGTRINILDLMDGEWFSVYDVPGVGQGDVDYITFENIESPDYKNIIIGWQPESSAENEMAIYTYDNFKLDIRYKERYSQSIIRDLNGDGLMDVALISLNEHTIRLVTAQDGDIRSAHELSISKSIRSISQLTFGRLPQRRTGALFRPCP